VVRTPVLKIAKCDLKARTSGGSPSGCSTGVKFKVYLTGVGFEVKEPKVRYGKKVGKKQ